MFLTGLKNRGDAQITNYEIFELLDEKGSLRFEHFGMFGEVMKRNKLRRFGHFPKNIVPMKNGKILFFPERAETVNTYIEMEEWCLQEDIDRKTIDFPFNFTEKMIDSWLIKV